MSTKTQSKITTDHSEIKKWAEERGGRPAIISDTEKFSGEAMIRIKFAEENDLKPIDWDDFFSTLDSNNLAMLYQDQTKDGETSRFHKIVSKDSEEARERKDSNS